MVDESDIEDNDCWDIKDKIELVPQTKLNTDQLKSFKS